MKKFIIACLVIFTASIACKKEDIGGGGLCACSPTAETSLQLAVKNAAGQDLLDTKLSGSYTEKQIQLFQKDGNGNIKQIEFMISAPIAFDSQKFDFYQIRSSHIVALAQQNAAQVFYLKLGDREPLEISLSVNVAKRKIEKLVIDKKEIPAVSGSISNYLSLFAVSL